MLFNTLKKFFFAFLLHLANTKKSHHFSKCLLNNESQNCGKHLKENHLGKNPLDANYDVT